MNHNTSLAVNKLLNYLLDYYNVGNITINNMQYLEICISTDRISIDIKCSQDINYGSLKTAREFPWGGKEMKISDIERSIELLSFS